jgi:colicin import membrane protein
MRIGNPLGATGLLERKEQLRKLETRSGGPRPVAQAREAREVAQQALHEAEESLEELRKTLREAEDAHREARTEESDRSERRSRLAREQESLLRHLEATRTSAARTRERAREARAELEGLQGEEEGLMAAREEARNRTARVHESWERARGEESRLTVELTRLEGELQRIQDRGRELEQVAAGADRRLAQLDEEEIQSRAEVESTGNRHRLELEAGSWTGRIGRIQERLEGEWGRPLARLLDEAPLEGTEEELRTRAREVPRPWSAWGR